MNTSHPHYAEYTHRSAQKMNEAFTNRLDRGHTPTPTLQMQPYYHISKSTDDLQHNKTKLSTQINCFSSVITPINDVDSLDNKSHHATGIMADYLALEAKEKLNIKLKATSPYVDEKERQSRFKAMKASMETLDSTLSATALALRPRSPPSSSSYLSNHSQQRHTPAYEPQNSSHPSLNQYVNPQKAYTEKHGWCAEESYNNDNYSEVPSQSYKKDNYPIRLSDAYRAGTTTTKLGPFYHPEEFYHNDTRPFNAHIVETPKERPKYLTYSKPPSYPEPVASHHHPPPRHSHQSPHHSHQPPTLSKSSFLIYYSKEGRNKIAVPSQMFAAAASRTLTPIRQDPRTIVHPYAMTNRNRDRIHTAVSGGSIAHSIPSKALLNSTTARLYHPTHYPYHPPSQITTTHHSIVYPNHLRTHHIVHHSSTPVVGINDVNSKAEKSKRAKFTDEQLAALNDLFGKVSNFPSKGLREEIALKHNLEAREVQVWFQNKRRTLKHKAKLWESALELVRKEHPNAINLGEESQPRAKTEKFVNGERNNSYFSNLDVGYEDRRIFYSSQSEGLLNY